MFIASVADIHLNPVGSPSLTAHMKIVFALTFFCILFPFEDTLGF